MENNKMSKNLDARGLTCPAPVLMVKDLVEKEKPNELTVIVDNAASSENVGRFLATRNYLVSEEHQNGDFYLLARRKEGGEQSVQTPAPPPRVRFRHGGSTENPGFCNEFVSWARRRSARR